jgi:hypothetical protein
MSCNASAAHWQCPVKTSKTLRLVREAKAQASAPTLKTAPVCPKAAHAESEKVCRSHGVTPKVVAQGRIKLVRADDCRAPGINITTDYAIEFPYYEPIDGRKQIVDDIDDVDVPYARFREIGTHL